MILRKPPFEMMSQPTIKGLVHTGQPLTIPPTVPPPIKQLILHCWKPNPRERLTVKQLIGDFIRIEEEMRNEGSIQSTVQK